MRIRRILMSIGIVAAVGGVTFAVASADRQVRMLTAKRPLTLVVGTPLRIRDMAPGDTAQRLLTVTNTTGRTIRTMTFRVRRPPGALARPRRTLMVKVTTCTRPWVRRATRGPSYHCPGIKDTVVGTPRLPNQQVMRRLPPTPPGGRVYFRMIAVLRFSARDNLQGRSVTIRPTILIGRP